MSRLSKAFKKQQSKYGGYAALLITLMIIIVVVINLLVSEVDWTFDASVNSVFSISEASEVVAKGVSEPVTIYGLFELGSESKGYDLIVSNYTKLSKNIRASIIDPIKNPVFSQQYIKDDESISEGSYIVVAEETGRYKIINAEDIIDNSFDTSSGEEVSTIVLEQQLTSAIKYVTSTELPIVYQVSGHGEEPLPDAAIRAMTLENYEVKELILMDEGSVPEDCGVLILNGPTSDINEVELQMLNAYFDAFGSAITFMGIVSEAMPNFDRLFENYGIEIHQESMVFESNANNYYQSPVLLIPNIETHPITEPLINQNMRVTSMTSQYIEVLDIARDELIVEPLLTTSDSAYAKIDISNDTIALKEEGDVEGPFIIAAAITDHKEWDSSLGENKSSKMIVVSNSVFLKAQAYAAEPNFDFLIHGTNWLIGNEDTSAMYIQPKNVNVMPLQMSAMEIYIYAALTVIVIPLIILVTGLIVWRKRRHL